jgi:hypothetical protein
MRIVVPVAIAALGMIACSKPTELASEANAVYEKGKAPALPPESVTLDSVAPVELPADAAAAPGATGEALSDYLPKTTADTVTDYRPSVSSDISALPAVGNPPALAQAFLDWKSRAAASPGSFEAGDAQLGAEPQQYKPSDAELVAAEAGDRLSAAVTGADDATKVSVSAVLGPDPSARNYKRFDYRHSDVAGSGRLFYASSPQDATVPGV